MGKWWALLFGVTILACTALFVISPFIGWWLPPGHSTHSWGGVDFLFYLILWITGFFFLLTEGLLVLFMFCFDGKSKPVADAEPAETESKPDHSHRITNAMAKPFKRWVPNETRLELMWTAIPAGILLMIAFVQVIPWARIKYVSNMPEKTKNSIPLPIGVSARQFEWRMRYPSPETWKDWKEKAKKDPKLAARLAAGWVENPQIDDVHVVNELHVWTNEKAKKEDDFPPFVVHLSTIDVQHNFNMPHFRVKQDALPGKVIPVWFRPTESNTVYNGGKNRWEDGGGWDDSDQPIDKSLVWEVACAELCGRWHYNMIAKVYVHPHEEDFLRWLEQAAAKQNTTQRE